MKTIPVIYSFARSGGTLVNQLLGVHPNCLVLSEVNPAASYKPVAEQALEWLGLISPQEVGKFSSLPYPQKILTLHDRAAKKGARLIIRDWVTVNFLPECAGDTIMPSNQLEQELYLSCADMESKPLVISRRSASVYESIRQNFRHLQNLELEVFAASYLKYAQAVSNFPKIHLESLRTQPCTTLEKILRQLDLESGESELMMQKFHDFRKCTGNITLQSPAKSASSAEILPPTTLSHPKIISSHPSLVEADRLFNYD